jgi:hypothetical protein
MMKRAFRPGHRTTGAILVSSLILFSMSRQSVLASSKSASIYVKLSGRGCTTVSENEDEDRSTLRCGKSVGRWTVFVEYADSRESIALKKANQPTVDLNFFQFHGSFSDVGPVLEFRTRNGVPVSAIVRFNYVVDVENNISTSALMVAKLAPRPCVVADIAASPKQAIAARAAADKAGTLPCLQPSE